MSTTSENPKQIQLEHRFLGELCKTDDNLLSFLCGIFSSIPLTLCFAFTKLGDSWLEHLNFALVIFSIITSLILVVFAFQFTLRKLKYISPLLTEKGETDQNDAINYLLSDDSYMPLTPKQEKRNKKPLLKRSYMVRPIIGFLISGIVLQIAIIGLWVLCNFID